MIENKNREIAVLTKQLNTARDQVSALKSSVTNLTNEKVSAESDRFLHHRRVSGFCREGNTSKRGTGLTWHQSFQNLFLDQNKGTIIVLVIPAKRTADAD